MDPVSLGASILVSATARHIGRKTKRMVFLDDAVETAANRVAQNHAALEPDVFPAIFRDEQVKELVQEFESGGSVITPAQVAHAFEGDMLGAEVEATPEELVTEFLEYLEQEISQQPEIGQKLLMNFTVGNQKSKELAAVRRWQDNTDLPISVRRFAEEAEQYLLDDIEQTNEFLDQQ